MHKSRGLRYLIWAFVISTLAGCSNVRTTWYTLNGKTMGTTYHVEYYGSEVAQTQIDSLLQEINQSVSTYIPTSTISKFNDSAHVNIPLGEAGNPTDPLHRHFLTNLEEAVHIYEISDGYFDPTVGLLVEAWGFGNKGRQTESPDSIRVDSLLLAVGMHQLSIKRSATEVQIAIPANGMRLDFSALAKGYGVDLVFAFLESKDAQEIFVEIGGEVRVSGKSPRGDAWVLGINTPEESADLVDIAARIRLTNAAMATSGNYRNVYVLNGRKVWHTIDPKTGFPEENDLLSASIVHPSCMTADALATACMAMGAERAMALIKSISNAEGYFIYRDIRDNITTFTTPNLTKDILPE
jgi:thiamine biosynthesis lipoprotein